jgi:hypothetical protein
LFLPIFTQFDGPRLGPDNNEFRSGIGPGV